MQTHTVEVKEVDGELVLDLGLELCAQLGWQVGDALEWKDLGNGSWQLIKLTTAGCQTP
jgi:hypothetical protein